MTTPLFSASTVKTAFGSLTFLPLEQIDEMDHWEGEQLNKAKEILAYELTKMVHGEEEAEKAQATARGLFSGAADHENMPSTKLDAELVKDGGVGLLDKLAGFTVGAAQTRGNHGGHRQG